MDFHKKTNTEDSGEVEYALAEIARMSADDHEKRPCNFCGKIIRYDPISGYGHSKKGDCK